MTLLFQTPDKGFNIPVIDFSGYTQAGSISEKRKIADKVVNAFKDSGFIYLEGHGIPPSVVDNAFQRVREHIQCLNQ